MSLTLPTAFENARRQRASGSCFLLELKVGNIKIPGSDYIYLSTRSFELIDESIPKVEAYVQSFSPIVQGVDFYSHEYKMNACHVTVTDKWISLNDDDASMYSMMDIVGNGAAYGNLATIYLYPGGAATQLSDCIKLLVGKVTSAQMTTGGVQLKIDELDRWNHQPLPKTTVNLTNYPNCPNRNVGATIGLCLGEFEDNVGWEGAPVFTNFRFGLQPGLLVEAGETYTYILTEGETQGINRIYVYIDALKSWSANNSVSDFSKSTDANGNTIVQLDPQTVDWWCALFPTAGYASSSASVRVMNAADGSRQSQPCAIYASSSSYADVVFLWHQNGSSDNDALYNSLASIGSASPKINLSVDRQSGAITSESVDIWDGSSWQSVSTALGTDDTMVDHDISSAFNWTGANGIFWHLGTGPNNGDGKPTAIRVRFENSGASWSTDSTLVAEINEINISISHGWPRPVPSEKIRIGGPGEKARRRGALDIGFMGNTRRTAEPESVRSGSGGLVAAGPRDNVDGFAVQIQGIKYPSPGWGDNHSDPGSSIEDVPGIIEYLLRDQLGISDIDVPSFQAVNLYHYGFPIGHLSLPHGSSISSKQLIETLCWENGIFLIRSRNGDIKMFDYEVLLDDLGTIFPFDLVNGIPVLGTTDSNDFYNSITVEWSQTSWNDGYLFRHENVDDSTSTAKIGTKHKDISLTFMRGSSYSYYGSAFIDGLLGDSDGRHPIDRLLDRLVGGGQDASKTSPEYLMSRPHALITLDTIGHKFAHAEPGDYFALDSTTFDPVMKCWGESWSGKSFMVYETEVHENKVVIKGHELATDADILEPHPEGESGDGT